MYTNFGFRTCSLPLDSLTSDVDGVTMMTKHGGEIDIELNNTVHICMYAMHIAFVQNHTLHNCEVFGYWIVLVHNHFNFWNHATVTGSASLNSKTMRGEFKNMQSVAFI